MAIAYHEKAEKRIVACVARRAVDRAASRISRLRGLDGEAMTGDVRMAKYFPDNTFDLAAGGVDR